MSVSMIAPFLLGKYLSVMSVGEVAQGRANLSSYQVIVIVPWREVSGGGEISALETSHFTHRPCLTGGRDHMEQEGGYKYSQISN